MNSTRTTWLAWTAGVLGILQCAIFTPKTAAADTPVQARFEAEVRPILTRYCYECHADGANKGNVALDRFKTPEELVAKPELWWAVLKNVRADLMPPARKPRPTDQERAILEKWIKYDAFAIDPANPNPGRVTVRRLNRTEYRNTIRDLTGVDYNTDAEFPPDNTGHGFDTMSDVLSLSPLHLEKYVAAAKSIVAQTMPMAPAVVAEKRISGLRFKNADGSGGTGDGPLQMSYTKAAVVKYTHKPEYAGRYQLVLDFTANERYVEAIFDYNKCRLTFKVDGKVFHDQEYSRQGGKPYHFEFDVDWKPEDHELTLEVTPLTPEAKQVRSLMFRIISVTVRGPLEKDHWVPPPNYERHYPKPVPATVEGRRAYAHEMLQAFATKAFRRPVDDEMLDRLVKLAESVYTQPGRTFEAGIAQSMTVILASPRFLFREEGFLPGSPNGYALIDEYALASRLSYFLWSTMPDDELFRLTSENKLRTNLSAQVTRMLADTRSGEFVRHFVGQWLQARDIENVLINTRAVIANDAAPDPKAVQLQNRFRELVAKAPETMTDEEKKELADARTAFFAAQQPMGRRGGGFGFGPPPGELTPEIRTAMRRETEMVFEHILKNDRSLLELLDSDYTFLNQALATHYGITGVTGAQMRLVKLPSDNPRGGVLTQGTVLAVTSNTDRTSPVKRGLFILDNLLGIPPAPPPPDIPALDEAGGGAGKILTLRETLELHRNKPLCSSCHNRMDPIGLALENFNALGRFREKERGQAIEGAGKLITGEQFANVKELKRALVEHRGRDFYRCLTEKMLTYALGRGVDYYDTHVVDEMVSRIEKAEGRPSALVMGIIESAPFQKRRTSEVAANPPNQTEPSK